MGVTDQVAGIGLFVLGMSIYVYYTMWVIVTPFIDPSHVIQSYFLPRKYAITIPTVLLILLLTVVGAFIGTVMSRGKAKKKNYFIAGYFYLIPYVDVMLREKENEQ